MDGRGATQDVFKGRTTAPAGARPERLIELLRVPQEQTRLSVARADGNYVGE